MTTVIAAVIAAAGASHRMGQPKQLLPWGEGTVVEAVVRKVLAARADPVLCVLGHQRAAVAAALNKLETQWVDNPAPEGGLLGSYQTGVRALAHLGSEVPGVLFALGDQPHVPQVVFGQVMSAARTTPDHLVFPSFQRRRGHPFYLPRALWDEVLDLPQGETMREVVGRHASLIRYVEVDTDAILLDMDTPVDYQSLLTRFGPEG